MLRNLLLLVFLLSVAPLFAEEWLPVQEVDLRVAKGSALDFRPLFMMNHADSGVNLRVTSDGHFASVENKKGGKQRLLCAVVSYVKAKGGFPNKAEAEQFADELQRRGYNLLRLHKLDTSLMTGARKDFDFNQVEMDKMFYLISALKRRGIYVEIDAQASWNGGHGDVKSSFTKNKYMMQLEIYLKQGSLDHWEQLVRGIFLKKNPYTGLTLLHDPNIAMITLMNEMGLYKQLVRLYNKRKHSEELKLRLQQDVNLLFQDWLKQKYVTVDKLNKSWGLLLPAQDFSEVTFYLKPHGRKAQADVTTFIYDIESRVQTKMIQFLRDEGYQGLITNMNASKELLSGSSREELDVVTLHTYHDHPRKVRGENRGTRPQRKQQNTSSLSDDLKYIRAIAPNRLSDKPFIVDEYNHPFPNPWRREAGLVFPAYASFQDWDGICRFSDPIQLSYRAKGHRNAAISAFSIGLDPIARAGEALSALLFRRGDVSVAERTAVLHLDEKAIISRGKSKYWSTSVVSLGLGMRLASNWNGTNSVEFIDQNKIVATVPLSKILLGTEAVLRQVFEKPEKAAFTKPELQLLGDKKQFIVESKQTLAVTFSGQDNQIFLQGMKVSSIHDAGLVSVSSLDNQPVFQSKRLLLTFQTDARNSNMVFSADGKTVKEHGSFPVKILRGKLSVVLQHQTAMKLYALNLRGERVKELVVKYKQGELTFDLDNKVEGWGPVIFYELVEDLGS